MWPQPILSALGSASLRLSRRNLRVLYDVLDTLSEAMGDAMAAPELVPLYMGPLFQRFQAFEVQVRQCPWLSLMEYKDLIECEQRAHASALANSLSCPIHPAFLCLHRIKIYCPSWTASPRCCLA